MRVIAIDDEPVALDILRTHAEKVPFVKFEHSFLSATEALIYANKETPDLILLDIDMPDLSGLEFAEMMRQKTQIIFTTAHAEHALKGFELAATDYLLKPINFGRFLKACELARSRMHDVKESNGLTPDFIFVKDGYDWVRINLAELLYVKAEDNYVSLVTIKKSVLTRMTLTEMQEKLPADEFIKVHKSYIVAVNRIEKIEQHQITVYDSFIPLSKSYRDLIYTRIQHR
ncbi:LytR/AlgR family response regulator transcription factor [Pedobacter duraquae]|uniref:LytTR family two component transcriptional regulator n=1 Tax=Pedobacter duraquae TaxID=425511 RepID=A0A4R6ICI8_9SPHI|nr:LytTR family DNA-binding domain-containing protein [Pedobacter duraquae]TDO19554.1 LytTR family two component transcriptional regulator [Pedobacter duraquae]